MNLLSKRLAVFFAVALFAAMPAAAADHLWIRTIADYVNIASNWTPSGIPGSAAGDRAIIDNGHLALIDGTHLFGSNRLGSGIATGEYALLVGDSTGAGSLLQSGGAVDSDWGIRLGSDNYGYYGISGGTLTVRSPRGSGDAHWVDLAPNNMAILVGSGSGNGVYTQTAGTVNQINSSGAGWIQTVMGGSGTSDNLMNISGGFFGPTNAGGNTDYAFCMGWIGHSGRNVLNLGGSGVLDVTQGGVAGGRMVLGFMSAGTELNVLNIGDASSSWGGSGGVNGGGGTLVAASILGGPVKNPGGGIGIVNFHGGTLKAAAAASPHGTWLYANNAYIYSEGAVFDTQNGTTGTNQIIGQMLEAPGGDGVSSIVLGANHGSGYIGEPVVTLADSGGTGSGATARAIVDLNPASSTFGQITSLIVTNPGVNYSGTVTATLSGGGPSAVAPSIDSIATAPNVSGGLTKTGLGMLTLNADTSYTGATIVEAGTLYINKIAVAQGPTCSILVKDTATLAGESGIYASNILPATTVETGGKIAPGAVGRVLYFNALNLADGAILDFKTATGGTSDRLEIVGGDVLPSGTTGDVVVTVNYDGTVNAPTQLLLSTGYLSPNVLFQLPAGLPKLDSQDGINTPVTLVTTTGYGGTVTLTPGGAIADPKWNVTTGNYNTPGSWDTNTVPNGGGQRAMFVNPLGAGPINVSLNTSPQLSSMVFDSPTGESYKITPTLTNSITLDSTIAQNWHISVLSGTHEVGAKLKLQAGSGESAIRLADGSKLTLSGVLENETTAANVNVEGKFKGTDTLGNGILVLSGANTYTGKTKVTNAVLEIGVLANVNTANSLGKSDATPANLTLNNANLRYIGTAAATTDRGMTLQGNVKLQCTGDATFSTSQFDGSACSSLTIAGPGKMTLNNATLTMPNTADLGELWIGDNATGVLNVSGTSEVTSRGLVVGKTGGSTSGQGGAMLQSGGTVTVYGDGGDPGSSFSGVVVGHTAYGYYKMTGGELNLNSGDSQWPFFFVGLNAPGVFEQTGGTVASPRAENTILGRFEEPGVMNITGGVYQESHISANNGILLGFGSSYTGRPTGSTGILNIGGGTTLATVDVTAGTVSGSVVLGEGDNGTGILNLRANGVLKAGCVTGGGYNGFDGMGIFNFHGGTLAVGTTELAPNLTSFMEGLDHACVYSEGAVVDTNGIDTTIAQVLEKPADSGIKRIDVGSGGGSGYIGTPVVLISGSATGVGATAVAVMNGDKIDHFVITNPGSGYQDTDVLTVTLSGGGYATQATATIGTGSTYFAANVSGGLTKTGLGTLTLTADNTFTGPTKVLAGALSVATIPNGGADSPLGASTSAASNLVLDGGKLLYTGADATTDRGFALGAAGGAIENAAALTFTGLVTDDGSGGGLTKDGAGTLTLAGDVGYAGDTVINDGLLQINSASAIVGKVYGAGSLAVGDGATLTATSIQVDTLTIGGTGGAALAAVPEPSVFALLALAAMSLAGIAWSKRK